VTRLICGAEIALEFDHGSVSRTAVCERREGPCLWRTRQADAAPRVVSPPYSCGAMLDEAGEPSSHP